MTQVTMGNYIGNYWISMGSYYYSRQKWIWYFSRSDESNAKSGDMSVCIVGLRGAGKSTLLRTLNLGEIYLVEPKIMSQEVETLEYKTLNFHVWDMLPDEDGFMYFKWLPTERIIFVVDCSDVDRFEKAKEELWKILNICKENSRLLIYANKHDLPNAISVPEVIEKLGLREIQGSKWNVQPTCGVDGSGLFEGLDWIIY